MAIPEQTLLWTLTASDIVSDVNMNTTLNPVESPSVPNLPGYTGRLPGTSDSGKTSTRKSQTMGNSSATQAI